MNYFRTILLGLALSTMAATQAQETQELPKPQVNGGMPLMEAIAARQSSRDINPSSTVTTQQLSDMLWAAWGITHDGKHTIATAMNRQELSLYVITPTQASKYDPASNTLTVVAKGDFRNLAAMQPYAKTAPVNIVFVIDTSKQDKVEFQGYSAGAASQNVYLYCAQAGLKTVVRASFDHEGLAKALKLASNEKPLLVQTVGK